MPILYLETSFVVGFAVGREPDADRLLDSLPDSVRVAIPAICYMEAFSFFEEERRRRNRFLNEVDHQVGELRRNLASLHAATLVSHLELARLENERLLNDIHTRLFDIVARLADRAEPIHLLPKTLLEAVSNLLIAEPTDNLILTSILDHARAIQGEEMILLSSNTRDFGSPEVRALLESVGIRHFFATVRAVLGWVGAQSWG